MAAIIAAFDAALSDVLKRAIPYGIVSEYQVCLWENSSNSRNSPDINLKG